MITTIDNAQRIFWVTGDMNTSIFCNIQDLEAACDRVEDKDSIVIRHKWNNKFTRVNKKALIDMLKALDLNVFIK
jgi:hypothetical protein